MVYSPEEMIENRVAEADETKYDDMLKLGRFSAGLTRYEKAKEFYEKAKAAEETKKDEIERGQVLAHPKSITPHNKFESQVYVLTQEEGGRHTPFFDGYRPEFYFRTTDVTGALNLQGADMCMPGDNVVMEVTLGKPIAMEQGLRFAVREGGRTVGSGVVVKVVE